MAVYDCFMFSNELLLLELRFHELAAVVDRFVLVEGTRNFDGTPKPLHFADNRERFRPFLEKVVHVVVDDLPPFEGNAWVLENFQRNAIARGLRDCRPDDLVLLSDADEIPRAATVAGFDARLGVVENRLYYYKFNLQMVEGGDLYLSTRLVRARDLESLQALRKVKGKRYPWWRLDKRPPRTILRDGGWHFSYLFGADDIARKVRVSAHQEFNTGYFTDAERIERCMREGRDLFDRAGRGLRAVPLDESFPAWVRGNAGRLGEYLADPPPVEAQARAG